jgi:predicted DNA-binding protein with PD1-like motif
MQAKAIDQETGQRTFVVVLDTDDEVMASLKRFVEQEKLRSGQFTAIGGFRSALLGYFDWERKDYRHSPVSEQVEVASFIGDLATGPDGKIVAHVEVSTVLTDAGLLLRRTSLAMYGESRHAFA